MAGLDDVNIDALSLDQMESLARGDTAGLLPEVSPVSDPKPEPKPEPKAEPKVEAKAEPAKAEPAKTEPVIADDDDEPAPADPNSATIPYQKWARDKKKMKSLLTSLESKIASDANATAKERDEMREKWQRADERLRLLSEAMTPPAAEPVNQDPEPDPQTDILAWVEWNRRENGRLREVVNTTNTTVENTRSEQQLHENYTRDVADYVTKVTDWGTAYNHLITTRAAMLQQQGYPEQQIIQIIRTEEKGLVQRAVKSGKRPAAMVYEMAKSMGYRTPEPQPDPTPVPAAAANGHANGAAAVPAAEAKPSVVEEVERIQRGMAGAKSLADVGGSAAEVGMEALAAMSDKEFAQYAAKHGFGRIDNIMGKRH